MELRTPPPAPPVPREHGARVHDGFYLRFASGFSVYEEQADSDESSLYNGEIGGRTVGVASVGEFAIGGTIGKGLVLGGGIYTAKLLSGHFRLDDESAVPPPSELDPESRALTLVGPFLDWYPRPNRGFHLQAALGLASITSGSGFDRDDDDDDIYRAYGGGIMLGVGYEWWIGDEWSLGALARAQAVVVSGEDDADVRWVHGINTGPGLLLSLTYH